MKNRRLLDAASCHTFRHSISSQVIDDGYDKPSVPWVARANANESGEETLTGGLMDDDLERMSREQLIAEVKKLRGGIREHRDSTLHKLCWHHPALWGLLPEKTDPVPVVPAWPQFMQGCVKYRQSLDEQAPGAPRSTEAYQTGPARR